MTIAFLFAILVPAVPVQIGVAPGHPPLLFAAHQLRLALAAKGVAARVVDSGNSSTADIIWEVAVPKADSSEPETKAESYSLNPVHGGLRVRFADEVGGMYALLDLAERAEMKGLAGIQVTKVERHAPAVPFRGVNPFLSIPMADKSGKRDWEHWWFTDMTYWKGYLDLLARSRINWIDMHGMYDLQTTSFPNMWPYFVVSDKYPDVGMPPEQAAKNLKALGTIIKMAKDRGIKFGLMNYTGGWNWPGARKAPERPVEDFIEYTKEGVKKILAACPDLGMIGFRIGESGYGEDFYAKSYLAALDELGKPLPLYTRTWGADKKKLMGLGAQYPDKFLIEIKYNGEQMGPPWHIAGGRMARWRDYSYQDYLFYPRAYNVVWQVRANGTNRVFQWASYKRIRDCVKTTTLANSAGYTVEPMCTYFPLDDFLHKKPLYKWEFERNSIWYLMWGRLGYDPATWEDLFRLEARRKWGADGDKGYDLLQAMSEVVPEAIMSYNLGPDHRDHAVELETGGSIRKWASGQPFDTYYMASPREMAMAAETGEHSGKLLPGGGLGAVAPRIDALLKEMPETAATEDLRIDALMLGDLAKYYQARLYAATLYAVEEHEPHGGSVKESLEASQKCWQKLADDGDKYFKPFIDRLRMHSQNYLWSQSTHLFDRDESDMKTMLVSDAVVPAKTNNFSNGTDGGKVWPDQISHSEDKQKLLFHADIGKIRDGVFLRHVNLLWKPLRSEVDWVRVPMDPVGNEWQTSVDVNSQGGMYGLEVITDKYSEMAMLDGRPYGVIDPWEVKR